MSAKEIILRPIASKDANAFVKRVHYSHKSVNNSNIHFGVFYRGKLEGVMSFGSPMDKRKVLPLVRDTLWNEMVELNRLAFTDVLPRNSESRALAIAFKLLRKHAPHLKWVLSFADGTQCGDGTIYRASGFVLTGIKKNDQIWIAPDGEATESRLAMTNQTRPRRQKLFAGSMTMLGHKGASKQRREILSKVTATKDKNILETGAASMRVFKELGWTPLEGYQLRYIYFLDPAYRERLTVPVIPFTEIDKRGAGMYRGQKRAPIA